MPDPLPISRLSTANSHLISASAEIHSLSNPFHWCRA